MRNFRKEFKIIIKTTKQKIKKNFNIIFYNTKTKSLFFFFFGFGRSFFFIIVVK